MKTGDIYEQGGKWYCVAQMRADGTVHRRIDVTSAIVAIQKQLTSAGEDLCASFVARGEELALLREGCQQLKVALGRAVEERDDFRARWVNLNRASKASGRAISEALDVGVEDGARVVHAAWHEARVFQGYHRRRWWHWLWCRRCHACLVPYDDLPSDRQEVDRRAFVAVRQVIREAIDQSLKETEGSGKID